MKDINLINPVPPTRQREVRLWFLVSLLLVSGITVSIATISVLQLQTLHQIKTEKEMLQQQVKDFTTVCNQQQTCVQEEQTLKKHLAKIDRCATCPKNPIGYMDMITKACTDSTQLQSLVIGKKSFELTAQCANPRHATQVMKHLTQSPCFHDVAIVSMQPVQQMSKNGALLFTLKGSIKKSHA